MMILDAAAVACPARPDHARGEPRDARFVFKVQANIDSQHRDWIASYFSWWSLAAQHQAESAAPDGS
jgi:hypothetical protein